MSTSSILTFIGDIKTINFADLSKMASNRYAVIEFKDGVSLAAEKWITPRKTHCYWPPYKNESRLLKAVENQEDATEDWPRHDIVKILTTTSTFNQFHMKLHASMPID